MTHFRRIIWTPKVVFALKKWFRPANSVRSTRSLVKIHNTQFNYVLIFIRLLFFKNYFFSGIMSFVSKQCWEDCFRVKNYFFFLKNYYGKFIPTSDIFFLLWIYFKVKWFLQLRNIYVSSFSVWFRFEFHFKNSLLHAIL